MVFENCTKTSCRHRQVRAQFYGILLLLDLLSKFIAPITEQEEEGYVERIHRPSKVNFLCPVLVGLESVEFLRSKMHVHLHLFATIC